jgi:hypothetical protein
LRPLHSVASTLPLVNRERATKRKSFDPISPDQRRRIPNRRARITTTATSIFADYSHIENINLA